MCQPPTLVSRIKNEEKKKPHTHIHTHTHTYTHKTHKTNTQGTHDKHTRHTRCSSESAALRFGGVVLSHASFVLCFACLQRTSGANVLRNCVRELSILKVLLPMSIKSSR